MEYKVRAWVAPTGEVLSTVVRCLSGEPQVLAMRFALHERVRGSSGRLRALMMRIAELYDAFEKVSGSARLEPALGQGNLTSWQIARASAYAERNSAKQSTGTIERAARGGRRSGSASARRVNRRLTAWRKFIKWGMNDAGWRFAPTFRSREEARARGQLRNEILELLDAARFPEPSSNSVRSLDDFELSCIEDAFAGIASVPFPERAGVLWRTSLIYKLARWGGLRIGEILTLYVSDLADSRGQRPGVTVTRRPGNLRDPRGVYAPSVKRYGRRVTLPLDVVDELSAFVRSGRFGSRSPFMFVSQAGVPLSVTSAYDAVHHIRAHAIRCFEERHPSIKHSLGTFSWHRLRHRRAEELLDVFFPLDKRAPKGGEDEFLAFFGWSSRDSATPYIREHLRRRADLRLAVSR